MENGHEKSTKVITSVTSVTDDVLTANQSTMLVSLHFTDDGKLFLVVPGKCLFEQLALMALKTVQMFIVSPVCNLAQSSL